MEGQERDHASSTSFDHFYHSNEESLFNILYDMKLNVKGMNLKLWVMCQFL